MMAFSPPRHPESPPRHPETSPRHPELVSGPISPPTRSHRFEAQPHGQVAPFGVLAVDQVDLPLPPPVLELLLAGDRVNHLVEHLEVDEAMDPVARGETGQGVVPMLPQAPHQVGRNSDVQRAVMSACEEVDARFALDVHAPIGAEKLTLKQVQGDEKRTDFELLRHAELVSASIARTGADG